ELGIGYFEQYMNGEAFYQPSPGTPARSIAIPEQLPSYRLKGGTSALIKKLAEELEEDNVVLNDAVRRIEFFEDRALVHANSVYKASRVVLALPPKLWINSIEFIPSVPNDLARIALTTHTWMEESIKVALAYEKPFWRLNNQPAVLFSNGGPVTEFYDHSTADSRQFALCGFVRPDFGSLDSVERKTVVIDQVASAFGSEARNFTDYIECVWGQEDKTHSKNIGHLIPHQNNGNPIFRKSFYNGRLLISSSETAEVYPGYMEGAVVSASFTVDSLKLSEAY
ncbi:MAG: FAD-dependent oxidoreductase, partial [Bacteroidota bacterium]